MLKNIYRGSLEYEKILQGFLRGGKVGNHWSITSDVAGAGEWKNLILVFSACVVFVIFPYLYQIYF